MFLSMANCRPLVSLSLAHEHTYNQPPTHAHTHSHPLARVLPCRPCHRQELQSLSSATRGSAASSSSSAQPVPSSIIPPLPKPAKKKDKEIVRKMPEHALPPYIEANFRTMTFVFTRAPKVSDFPHERCDSATKGC